MYMEEKWENVQKRSLAHHRHVPRLNRQLKRGLPQIIDQRWVMRTPPPCKIHRVYT